METLGYNTRLIGRRPDGSIQTVFELCRFYPRGALQVRTFTADLHKLGLVVETIYF